MKWKAQLVNIVISSLENLSLLEQLYGQEEVTVTVAGGLSFSYLFTYDRCSSLKTKITFRLLTESHVTITALCTTERDIECIFILEEKKAAFNFFMRLELSENKKCTVTTEQLHKAPETISSLSIKAAVDTGSFYDYKGVIALYKGSVDADASLSNKVLLLDKTAYARSIPSLQVEHSKVTCSHGTAIDSIQEAFLYPLCMRGISYKDASVLYKEGFLSNPN